MKRGMKGYFGIGVEGVSKAMNVGTLFRTAHAFGAAFVFTLRAQYNRREGSASDTSDTPRSVPTYNFAGLEAFRLPQGCRLVGVEITDEAIELPSFRHPRQAAYILGAEREGLSRDLQSRCDYVVKIPTRFRSISASPARSSCTTASSASAATRRARSPRARPTEAVDAAGVRRADLQAPATGTRAPPRPGSDSREDRRGGRSGHRRGPGSRSLSDGASVDLQLRHRPAVGRRHPFVRLSQQLFDWYTPSISSTASCSTACCGSLLPRAPVLVRLAIAVGIEAPWEIAENSPWVIEAYRKQALAAGYAGDSILNSLSDTLAMMSGFALARLLPWKATVAFVLVLEIAAGPLVHDNLTLNILNFIHRFPAIEAWQMRAQR